MHLLIASVFMVGLYSYTIHHGTENINILTSLRVLNLPTELCITIHCAEIIFDAILVYGAHMNSVVHVKAYYYFVLTTALAVVVLQVINLSMSSLYMSMGVELLTFTFANFCMQVYLIIIVRSLLKKMEISGPHVYDNQLHHVVTGADFKVGANGVYNNTTAPTEL